MASQITNYQCPACTGPLKYAGDSGKLECEYCGSSFSVQEIEALFEEKDEAASQAMAEEMAQQAEEQLETEGEYDTSGDYWDLTAEGLRAYNCPSCVWCMAISGSTAVSIPSALPPCICIC